MATASPSLLLRLPPEGGAAMNTREFTAIKFQWLEQIVADRGLPSLALHVVVYILHYFSHDRRGPVRFGQEGVAEALRVHRQAVNKAIKALIDCGHLESTRHGPNKPNTY